MTTVSSPASQAAVLALLSTKTSIVKAKAAAAPIPSRKRTLTMANGEELDLQLETLPVSSDVINAMRQRILELEDELVSKPKPAKRARKSDASAITLVGDDDYDATPSTSKPVASSAAGLTKDDKKAKAQLKKIFDRVKKECKQPDFKFQGSSKQVKFDEIFSKEEFDLLFKGKGVLIQPTPQNKPTSTVTIIRFNSKAQIESLFGDNIKLSGFRWSKGGVPTRTGGYGFFGGGSTFSKSVKIGACPVRIDGVEVSYSKNGMKCKFTFDVSEEGGSFGGYDSDDY